MLLVNDNNKLLVAETSLNSSNPRRHHIRPTRNMWHRAHVYRHPWHLLQCDSVRENWDELSVSLKGDRMPIHKDNLRGLHKLCLYSRLVRE